jgi:carboxyl-terminal processing protease
MSHFRAIRMYSLLFLVSLGSLLTLNMAQALPSTNEQSANSTLIDLNAESQKLSKDDIQHFITAIALIHHYYIKDTNNNHLFVDAIRGMVDSLDPHSTYLDVNDFKELKTAVSGEFVGVGMELTLSKGGLLKVISPLDGSPAEVAGIKPNDYIIKINEQLVHHMSLQEAISKIKGKSNTPVTLTLLRKGRQKPLCLTMKRQTIHLISVHSKLLKPGYGYVRITFFQGPVEKQLKMAISKLKTDSNQQLKGLVLDLRNNPGGLLDASAQVADSFLDGNQIQKYNKYIVYTKGRVPGSDMHIAATAGDIISGIPMVVLINGGSASASEIVAGALQDYKRAIIMGTRSFGKGSVQTVLPINTKEAIKLTTALYYTPAGREIQAKGIIPNIIVPELKVQHDPEDLVEIDEANFQNHLPNDKKESSNEQAEQANEKFLPTLLKLAKTDYQLYQALMVLEGLHSARSSQEKV